MSEFDLFKIVRTWVDTTQKWVAANALCDGDEADDRTATNIDEAHYLNPMGFTALPVVTSTLKAFGWFDGHDVVLGWFMDKAKAVLDLLSGETRVYSVGKITVRIRLKADGSLSIESDGGNVAITATGGDVVLNGGTAKVIREGDAVNASTSLANWFTAIQTATGVAPPVGAIGVSSGGAANVKA